MAAQGWLIITRDRHIQSRPAELAAVREHRAKMVNLTSDAAGSTWEQLRVTVYQWPAFERVQGESGPFIYRTTLGGMSPIDLETGRVVSPRRQAAT